MRTRILAAALVTGLAAVLVSSPAAMAREVSERADMAPDGEVEVSNVSGSVEIIGWDRAEVSVSGSIWDGADDLVFEADGRRTRIEVKLPRNSKRVKASNLVIRMPVNAELDATTVSADITVDGVRGDQRLQTVSGEVATEIWARDLEAKTVSGDIDIRGNDERADVVVTAVSGDIDAANLSGELSISSVSGDVDASGEQFERLRVKTVSGDMGLDVSLADDGRADLESVNGDIELRLANVDNIEFDLETFNGDIRDVFGERAQRTSKYAPGHELRITVGTGSARVRIETLNGDIDVLSPGRARSEVRSLRRAAVDDTFDLDWPMDDVAVATLVLAASEAFDLGAIHGRTHDGPCNE